MRLQDSVAYERVIVIQIKEKRKTEGIWNETTR